jgi:hypothetical protein
MFDINSIDLPKAERKLIQKIVRRARRSDKTLDALSLDMDLTAVHGHACQLALQVLLDFDDFNFNHDVYGIVRHLNRRTGELMDFFEPRSALCYHVDRRDYSISAEASA